MKRHLMSAFTLVELLVAIAVIGILAALLLAAVQAAREAARRTECVNNLKQIALGLHNSHDTHGVFPMGQLNKLHTEPTAPPALVAPYERIGWAVIILPFIEQGRLHDRVRADIKSSNNYSFLQQSSANVVPAYVCPSDPSGGKTPGVGNVGPHAPEGFHSNYVACAGNTVFSEPSPNDGTKLSGVLFPMSRVSITQIKDGTSNQLMVSEVLLWPVASGDDRRGRIWNCWQGETLFSTFFAPNQNATPDACFRCPTAPGNPRAPCTEIIHGDGSVQSARSYHPAGVNTALADCSIRYIASSVDPRVWSLLGARNDGTPLDLSGL